MSSGGGENDLSGDIPGDIAADVFPDNATESQQDTTVCVFLASGYGWGTVMHEIPISSSPILMTSLPYPRTQ
jgi:hypothetical protein